MCLLIVYGGCGGQKRVLDSLELELLSVVNEPPMRVLETPVLQESSSTLNHQVISLVHFLVFFCDWFSCIPD